MKRVFDRLFGIRKESTEKNTNNESKDPTQHIIHELENSKSNSPHEKAPGFYEKATGLGMLMAQIVVTLYYAEQIKAFTQDEGISTQAFTLITSLPFIIRFCIFCTETEQKTNPDAVKVSDEALSETIDRISEKHQDTIPFKNKDLAGRTEFMQKALANNLIEHDPSGKLKINIKNIKGLMATTNFFKEDRTPDIFDLGMPGGAQFNIK